MSNVLRLPDRFEHCHSNGSAYETYKEMEPKFGEKFKSIELEYMVQLYMTSEHGLQERCRDFDVVTFDLLNGMGSIGVFYTYPYRMDVFPHTHPRAKEAVLEARKRMEKMNL